MNVYVFWYIIRSAFLVTVCFLMLPEFLNHRCRFYKSLYSAFMLIAVLHVIEGVVIGLHHFQ